MVTPRTKQPLFRVRPGTLSLLALTAILTAVAAVVGVSDNPPGIILLYTAGITLVLAGTHRWRNPQKFGILFIASVVGFFLTVLIHNFAEVGAEKIAHLPVLAAALSAVSIGGFFLAVILCPMGGVVGAIGTLLTSVSRWRAAS